MANLAPQLMQTTANFYGHDARAKEDMSPTEFLRRQIDTMNARDANAIGSAKVTATTSNFRGEASTWWNLSLPNQLTTAEMATLRTDWDAFVTRFKMEYFPFVHRADANLNWVGLKQLPNESAYGYLQRVFNAATAFADTNLNPGDVAVPASFEPPPIAGNGHRAAAIAALDGLDAQEKLSLSAAITAARIGHMQAVSKRYTTCVAVKVVLNGLRDARLRPTLQRSATDDDDISRMLTNLRLAETNLPKNFHQPKVGGNGNGNGVHAVTASSQALDGDGSGMAKIDADKKKKKKKKKVSKGPGVTPRPDNGSRCKFCHRAGHAEGDCFTKKKASEKQAEYRKMDAGKEGGLSAAADDGADEAADSQLSEALNAIRA